MQRQRSTPHTFAERLAAEKQRLERQLQKLPDGPAREELLQKIRQIEKAASIDRWLSSPGLQQPR